MNKKTIFSIKKFALTFFNLISFALSKRALVNSNSRRILVVKTDGIGDFIIFMELMKNIKENYKDYSIAILGGWEIKKYALKSGLCDDYIVFNYQKFKKNKYKKYISRKIENKHYEIVINLIYSRVSYIDYLVNKTNAKIRIGFYGDTLNSSFIERWATKRYYTNILIDDLDSIHEYDKSIIIGKYILGKFTHYTPKQYGGKDPNLVIIMPFSGDNKRSWPLDRFINLIKELNQVNFGLKFAILGGAANKREANYIVDECVDIKIDNYAGSIDFAGALELIGLSRLVITNETSIYHAAVYLNIPVICISGGGHFNRFVNYNNKKKYQVISKDLSCFNCDWACNFEKINGKYKCIDDVSLIVVKKISNDLLMN